MLNLEAEFTQISLSNDSKKALLLFYRVRELLESGELRVAERRDGNWQVNSWVKQVILWGFKYGEISEYPSRPFSFYDKDSYPAQNLGLKRDIRLVPGGSSVRSGAYVADGTVIMPPSYINVGAYIDCGCMIDSHALVGSCAQIGKGVHISAASQIGGVLEPVNAMPVIIEDNVFIGGNCGVYEGTIIKDRAVIGTGVILNSSTPIFDSTTGEFIRKSESHPLTVPQGAVVVAGSRPISKGYGRELSIHLYCPVIIKYRDNKTESAIELEDLLR